MTEVSTWLAQWLAVPEIQASVVPFIVAFVAALILRPLGGIASGLGFALGFCASAYFVMGFDHTGIKFTPLTGTRKLLLAGAGAVIVGLLADLLLSRDRKPWIRAAVFVIAGMGTALWLISPRLDRLEGNALWITIAIATTWAGWLAASLDMLNRRPLALAISALMLSIGVSVCALLGASAQIAQLSGAVAASAGALALVMVLFGAAVPGGGFALPAALLTALAGISAVLFARLPWYALSPLVLIPLLAYLPVPSNHNRFLQGLVLALYTAPAAAGAIALAWRAST
ncbi:MAG: hypothetical protein LBV36_07130 [Chromatiales bacterium]|jgi:hypothetical protein|nr:hypothetical protein [Chromatiales bacterium]